MPLRKCEDVIAAKDRPFTGAEYLESLRDGREVWIHGERVENVTTHPAFRNAARSIARLYDALHDPRSKETLTCPTETGSGGFTHRCFRVARSREDLIGQRPLRRLEAQCAIPRRRQLPAQSRQAVGGSQRSAHCP